jgi:dihydropteroate synthase
MNGLQFLNWLKDYSAGKNVRPLVMGILNITPDSFSDANRYTQLDLAYQHALQMVEAGADIIDIGGESTRPGATKISLDEELDRVIPILEKIRQHSDICISIDTYKPEVMHHLRQYNIDMINDVYALQQPGALEMLTNSPMPVCLMHMLGHPSTMTETIQPELNMVEEVDQFLDGRIHQLLSLGFPKEWIILDPGIGFGKTLKQNLMLINQLTAFEHFQQPILLGVSRKRMIGDVLERPVEKRLYGSLASNLVGLMRGAKIFRTHDVLETYETLKMANTIIELEREINE